MTAIQESTEILTNARAAYPNGELTAQQFCDVTRIPMMDMFLTLYANGEMTVILKDDIYIPAFARDNGLPAADDAGMEM